MQTSPIRSPRSLDAYLLGRVDTVSLLVLQQQFAQEVAQDQRHRAAAILCEHPPCRSRGTQTKPALHLTDEKPASNGTGNHNQEPISVRRPGGIWQHGPGQLVLYLTFSLSRTETA